LDNPLHVILNNSKLAYRIYVILIANKRVNKKTSSGLEHETFRLVALRYRVTWNFPGQLARLQTVAAWYWPHDFAQTERSKCQRNSSTCHPSNIVVGLNESWGNVKSTEASQVTFSGSLSSNETSQIYYPSVTYASLPSCLRPFENVWRLYSSERMKLDLLLEACVQPGWIILKKEADYAEVSTEHTYPPPPPYSSFQLHEPIWTYSIQLWGSASTSNIEILGRFQSKALRMITDAPRYVPNVILRQDLRIPSVEEEIRRFSIQYSSRLQTHLAVHLTEPAEHRRLKRHLPADLITRFQE
jgi:hypothetical protein